MGHFADFEAVELNGVAGQQARHRAGEDQLIGLILRRLARPREPIDEAEGCDDDRERKGAD